MALFQHGSSDVIDLDSVGTSKSFFSMSPWQFTCRQSGMTWVVRVCVAKRGLSWSVVNFIRCSDELQLKRHLFLNHEHGALWLLICSRHRTTLTCLLAYLDIYISTKLGDKVHILVFSSVASSKNSHALLKYQRKSLTGVECSDSASIKTGKRPIADQ